METLTKSILGLQADVCKAIARPKKLEISNALRDGEKRVNGLAAIVEAPKTNVFQHLARLALSTRRVPCADPFLHQSTAMPPKVLKACSPMREVLVERIRKNERLLNGTKRGAVFYE